MNFSKLKLQEGVATSAGATASIDTSQKGKEAASMGTQTAQTAKTMGNERLRRQRAQKADPRGAGQVFEDQQREVEKLKAYQSQKSDWRQELNEKVVDGQEREQHPYVTVMPTGDENLINAVKQMGKAVKGKKDAAMDPKTMNYEGWSPRDSKKIDKSISNATDKEKQADSEGNYKEADKQKGRVNAMRNQTKMVKEEELVEAKKKKCKEGYKRDENGNCVKEKKSKTTIVYGGRWGYGHGHDHDEQDDSNEEGGGESGGGDGGGGGMGEMFDMLGDMLLKEKMETGAAYHARMKEKNKSPINPYAVQKQKQSEKKRDMADTQPKIKVTGTMTDAVGKPRMGSSD